MVQKIYLAGGMRSNWQEKVIENVDAFFFNPKPKEKSKKLSLEEFGTWDLHHIKKCDIVFGYMEKDNPSGIGMAVELGYAKAIGKTVILCLEKDNPHMKYRYLEFMKKVSDVTYDDFDQALDYLKKYNNL